LATNLDNDESRRELLSGGAQLDLSLSILSTLDMTFSVGGGIAVEDGQQPRYEWMVSLKVLR
jgi:hypothetical protein